jgi:iron-sulfur cluster assembly accessory protein
LSITFTPEALKEAERLAATEPAYKGQSLRVYIEGKGCDGFYYGVAFGDALPDDTKVAQGSLTIVVDKDSLQFLEGSVVTWIDDERGRGFLVENPNHKKFRGKFYKKKVWMDRFAPPPATSSSR